MPNGIKILSMFFTDGKGPGRYEMGISYTPLGACGFVDVLFP